MSARIFVAGATGVLGRRVVPRLVAAGHEVTANVRNAAATQWASECGARTATVDLFDPAATAALGNNHDAVVNVATAIPTGASAARRSAWKMNDRIRTEASANLAAPMAATGGRYIGESITFPYVDAGGAWVDEQHPVDHFWGDESCLDAEAAAASVNTAGGVGITLRFAMFFADDSAHGEMIQTIAKRGWFAFPGADDSYASMIHIDDAASAVVAALDAPGGLYNVAEADPSFRSEHADALARAVGRQRLRRISPKIFSLGGASTKSLARSHRISSHLLTSATGWQAQVRVVEQWRQPASTH